MFFWIFLGTAHLIACVWVIAGSFDENSWVSSTDNMPKNELYLTSFYFSITTMTTVGYGDMSASSFTEKICCIFIMFVGVISFSFASGALANYIDKSDEQNAKFAEKNKMLDDLFKEYAFPMKLYIGIRKNIQQNYLKD